MYFRNNLFCQSFRNEGGATLLRSLPERQPRPAGPMIGKRSCVNPSKGLSAARGQSHGIASVRVKVEGIHRESPWCAPGTLLIQCRLHKTKKHTVTGTQAGTVTRVGCPFGARWTAPLRGGVSLSPGPAWSRSRHRDYELLWATRFVRAET